MRSARSRRPHGGDRAAHARARAGARARPRFARRSDGRCSTPSTTSVPPRSSKRSPRRRPPTTMRCSAWGAQCSCWDAIARHASRSRVACSMRPTRADYRLYRDRRDETPRGRERALPALRDTPPCSRRRCPMLSSTDNFRAVARRRLQYRKWAHARFFLRLVPGRESFRSMSPLQSEIEERLAAERAGSRGAARRGASQRNHCASSSTIPTASRSPCASASPRCSPTCASATRWRSPRPARERPLTKPTHFRRFVGRRARVRTREPRPVPVRRPEPPSGAPRASPESSSAPPTARSHWPPMGASSRSPIRRSVVRTSSRSRRENLCHARSWKQCTRWRARRASSPRS